MTNIHLIVDYNRVFLFYETKIALTEMNKCLFYPKFQNYITDRGGGKSSLMLSTVTKRISHGD